MNDHVLIWIVVLSFAFTVHGMAKPKTWLGTLKTVVFKTEGTLPLEMDIYYPLLLLTGEKDTTILPEQSESLHHRAQSLGLDTTYVLVKNSGHGWRPLGGPIVPSQEEIHRITADFIRNHTSR